MSIVMIDPAKSRHPSETSSDLIMVTKDGMELLFTGPYGAPSMDTTRIMPTFRSRVPESARKIALMVRPLSRQSEELPKSIVEPIILLYPDTQFGDQAALLARALQASSEDLTEGRTCYMFQQDGKTIFVMCLFKEDGSPLF